MVRMMKGQNCAIIILWPNQISRRDLNNNNIILSIQWHCTLLSSNSLPLHTHTRYKVLHASCERLFDCREATCRYSKQLTTLAEDFAIVTWKLWHCSLRTANRWLALASLNVLDTPAMTLNNSQEYLLFIVTAGVSRMFKLAIWHTRSRTSE